MKLFLGIAAIMLSTLAMAENEPRQSSCFFLDRACLWSEQQQLIREEKARVEAENHQRYLDDQARYKAEQEIKAEETRRLQEETHQKYVADQAQRKSEIEAADAADEKQERAAKARQSAKTSELKQKCGNDYKNPAIGMRIERLQECVSPVKLYSQINRADGVVSTYRSGSLIAHVMSGRVIAWDRY